MDETRLRDHLSQWSGYRVYHANRYAVDEASTFVRRCGTGGGCGLEYTSIEKLIFYTWRNITYISFGNRSILTSLYSLCFEKNNT